MGIKIVVSPSLHELKVNLPSEIWDHIQTILNSGKSATPYLKQIIEEDNPECAVLFKRYLEKRDEFDHADGHAITTHKRLLSMDTSKYDLVIIDEDIIFSTIIPNRTDISVFDLKKILKEIAASSPLAAKIRKTLKYIKSRRTDFFTLRKIPYDKEYADISMAVNIPAFCSATHFYFREISGRDSTLETDSISFVNPVEFGKNVKRIIVSATVDEEVCNYYFGANNVKFYECQNARYKGTLNQYADNTMSRGFISENLDVFDWIKTFTKSEHTISFMKFNDYYSGDLHYGNTAGCDYLKGKNIDVIGTPHQPEWIYKLFAYSLELDIDTDAIIKPNTPVQHNGWSFRFTTYSDEDLRAIQFYMIESELEQAVGRARLLREPCTVNLFSNFPLRQVNMKESGYTGKAQNKEQDN